MSKDPAFLFYPSDWIAGTMGMSFEEKGAYFEMLMFQFNHGHIDERRAIRILGEELWNTVKYKFSVDDNGLYYNNRLNQEKEKRINYTESRRKARQKSDEDSVRIYIVRDNIRLNYKIGSSVNPMRRYNELCNQINPAIIDGTPQERSLSLLWYSNVVDRKVEKIIHDQYKSFNIKGEWFKLSSTQIKEIINTYDGTYVERTTLRTENENENGNIIENRLPVEEIKNVNSEKSKRFTPEEIQELRSQNKCPLPDDYPVKWEAYVPAITEPERYCTEKGVVIDLLPVSEIMKMPSEDIREYASKMWALGADGYAREVGYLSDEKLKLERQLEEEEDAKNYQ